MTSIVLLVVLAARVQEPSRGSGDPSVSVSDAHVRAQVESYLASIDTPTPPAAWRSLGPPAEAILVELAQDSRSLPTRRAKALDGLAALGRDAAPPILRAAAAGAREPLVVRLAALRGLGNLLPHDALVTEIGSFMSGAGDPRVRSFAAEVLVRRGGQATCEAVQAHVEREAPDNRGHFVRALAACRGE